MKFPLMAMFFLYSIFLFFVTSCSVGPSYVSPPVEIPSEWKNKGDEDGKTNMSIFDHWWEVFQDKKLEELEGLALENNRDLLIAYERVEEAQALRGIAAADFYPQITLNPATTNTVELIKNYVNRNAAKTSNGLNPTTNSNIGTPFRVHEMLYFLPLNLRYEVDLWGKIKDRYQSATDHWLAKSKDEEWILLSLTSNLAIAYYQLRAADAQLELLQRTLKTREKAFEINHSRYEEQITFYADVSLAGEEVERVIAQYQEVLRQRKLLENLIAILIGMPPSEFSLGHLPLSGLPPEIPAGIPSEVLLRRPDVAEAEYQAQSEHALVKEAYAEFFPSLILTTTGGFSSPLLEYFLSGFSRYWSDNVQVNQWVFDGGRMSSQLKLHMARFREASASYQQQVLIAFQDVENALANLQSYQKEYKAALAKEAWAQKTYQLYLDRYLLGVTYYLDVANTERDWLNAQIDVNAFLGAQYLTTIQLIKALGGGWSSDF